MPMSDLVERGVVQVDGVESANLMAVCVALEKEARAGRAGVGGVSLMGELVKEFGVIASSLAVLDTGVGRVGASVIGHIDRVCVANFGSVFGEAAVC